MDMWYHLILIGDACIESNRNRVLAALSKESIQWIDLFIQCNLMPDLFMTVSQLLQTVLNDSLTKRDNL